MLSSRKTLRPLVDPRLSKKKKIQDRLKLPLPPRSLCSFLFNWFESGRFFDLAFERSRGSLAEEGERECDYYWQSYREGKGEGNDLCRLLLATIELSNRGGLSIRYTRKGKGFICRVYIYACMYVRSSFFLIRSRVRPAIEIKSSCEMYSVFYRRSLSPSPMFDRTIYIYIFLFCLEILRDSIQRLITLPIVPSTRIARIEEN